MSTICIFFLKRSFRFCLLLKSLFWMFCLDLPFFLIHKSTLIYCYIPIDNVRLVFAQGAESCVDNVKHFCCFCHFYVKGKLERFDVLCVSDIYYKYEGVFS